MMVEGCNNYRRRRRAVPTNDSLNNNQLCEGYKLNMVRSVEIFCRIQQQIVYSLNRLESVYLASESRGIASANMQEIKLM